MEHYYSNNPSSKSEEREIEYEIKNINMKFVSDNGVFSKNHVDFATDFLLSIILDEDIKGEVLDVGCGYGPIGITISKAFLNTKITMVDINERALNLAKKNIEINRLKNIEVIESDCFSNVDGMYEVIITNPPIRAGKEVIYNIYKESYNHLNKDGKLYLVINKKHGAPSTIKYLQTMFKECEILDKKAGFNVIRCLK